MFSFASTLLFISKVLYGFAHQVDAISVSDNNALCLDIIFFRAYYFAVAFMLISVDGCLFLHVTVELAVFLAETAALLKHLMAIRILSIPVLKI